MADNLGEIYDGPMEDTTQAFTVPVGERLGSERLFGGVEDQPSDGRFLLDLVSNAPIAAEERHRQRDADDEPEPERRDMPRPERRDLPRPQHQDPRKPAKQPHQPTRKSRLWAELATLKTREILSNLVEFAGIVAITTGSWLIRAWLGLLVLGLCLIILGVALGVGPGPRRPDTGRSP